MWEERGEPAREAEGPRMGSGRRSTGGAAGCPARRTAGFGQALARRLQRDGIQPRRPARERRERETGQDRQGDPEALRRGKVGPREA